MKRLEKGRNQTLSGKRKPSRKAAGAKPNANRQRQLAFRKKRRLDSQLKRLKTLARREGAAAESAATRTEEA